MELGHLISSITPRTDQILDLVSALVHLVMETLLLVKMLHCADGRWGTRLLLVEI